MGWFDDLVSQGEFALNSSDQMPEKQQVNETRESGDTPNVDQNTVPTDRHATLWNAEAVARHFIDTYKGPHGPTDFDAFASATEAVYWQALAPYNITRKDSDAMAGWNMDIVPILQSHRSEFILANVATP
jgi:hypothetical protein